MTPDKYASGLLEAYLAKSHPNHAEGIVLLELSLPQFRWLCQLSPPVGGAGSYRRGTTIIGGLFWTAQKLWAWHAEWDPHLRPSVTPYLSFQPLETYRDRLQTSIGAAP